jgi:hypothetical protein
MEASQTQTQNRKENAMSYSQILEVAIGLVLVYYLLGSIVSWITGMIIEMQETRGQVLEEYLKKTVGTKTIEDLKTGRKKEVNILADQYQIKSLQPIRYKNLLSVFGAVTEAKMVEKIPAATLVDAFFDVTGLTGRPKMDATELKNMINALPNSEGKQAMLKWIDQGVTNVNTLQARANAYFTGIIDQAASKFKANARSFVIILSIAITLILGTDSIQLAKDLWNNAELRAITAVQADALVQQGNQVLDLDAIIAELNTLSIVKFGWWQMEGALPTNANATDWIGFVFLKILGLSLTAACVSQGSSFWYDLMKKMTAPAASSSSTSSSSGGGTTSTSSSESS